MEKLRKVIYIGLWSLALVAGLSWGRISLARDETTGSPVRLVLQADKQTRVIDEGSGAERLVWQDLPESAQVLPGDLIRYQLVAENKGAEPLEALVLTQPIPAQTIFVLGSAKGTNSSTITYSVDGGKTFAAQPTIALSEDSSTGAGEGDRALGTQPAPAEAYTHIRWSLREAIQSGAMVTGEFQVEVK
ncbi:MAG: DUF11 domain-containing protein [Oscillatoria sp. SIO1A7]|nr:DUF11 domain-containing protein [Oscillatoria sp. SIO1A7]